VAASESEANTAAKAEENWSLLFQSLFASVDFRHVEDDEGLALCITDIDSRRASPPFRPPDAHPPPRPEDHRLRIWISRLSRDGLLNHR